MATELASLLEAEHGVRRSELLGLSQRDQQALAELAGDPGGGSRRETALMLLSTADPAAATPLLEQLLESADEREDLKALAVGRLARIGTADLEERLLRLLPAASSIALRARIASVLGRVGAAPAASALGQLSSADPSEAVRRRARSSRRLIRLRAGETPDDDEAPVFEERPTGTPQRARTAAAPEELAAEAIADVGDSLRGVTLTPAGAQTVETPDCKLLVLWNESVAAQPAAALERTGVAGVVAADYADEGTWLVEWIVTTVKRRGGGVALTVYDTFGDPVWGGRATEAWRREGATIAAFAGHRQPLIEATVRPHPDGLEVERVVQWERPPLPKRRPTPLD